MFADSRRTVEQLATQLGGREVETFVSHSSLSASERRRAETAFAEAGDCVVVSTSTLELGIDVGDLDRVLQVGASSTVASLLQRLGRAGRRPGTVRNMTLLSVDDNELLRGAGLSLLWSEGYVEPIVPPPSPHHLAGRRHFMELMSVFTSDPQVTVLHGRGEIGTVDPIVLLTRVDVPRSAGAGEIPARCPGSAEGRSTRSVLDCRLGNH